MGGRQGHVAEEKGQGEEREQIQQESKGSLVKWRKIETVYERGKEEKCVQTFHLKG